MAWQGARRTTTAAHQHWRKQVLARARGLCEIRGPGCTHRATHADHILNVARGGAEHDLANGQAACPTCHKAKTQAEAAEGRRLAAADRPRAKREPEPHPGLR